MKSVVLIRYIAMWYHSFTNERSDKTENEFEGNVFLD